VSAPIPVALTIAGSDCSAGAGAQADLKTFSACGVYGLTALTCVVAETPGRVLRIDAIDPAMVVAQIDLLLEEFPVAAVKTGMLYSAEIVSRVAATLRGRGVPVVVDPVMVATSGDLLLEHEAVDVYEHELFPLAAVITPNLDEAATLLGEPIRDIPTMREAGRRLLEKYRVPVLLKGGHLGGDTALDLLFAPDGGVTEFSAPFSHGVQTHGTGCTYAAAITAAIARGLSLVDAVREAKEFVTRAIAQHFAWQRGGHEALHALNHH
jgi:hydroxymethylpyrimidine/phosphomethylpyrimidine kinase